MAELIRPRPLLEIDDREAFDCGRDSMNNWLRRNGWRNHVTGMSRVSVVAQQESRTIVGYVTLSAAQIERAHLPKADQRNRPDPVPMTLLGQLAVDLRFQRQGHAASLMLHAFQTVVRFSRQVGCFGVMTHPLDEDVRHFYRGFGFVDLLGDPRRGMIVRVRDLEINDFG